MCVYKLIKDEKLNSIVSRFEDSFIIDFVEKRVHYVHFFKKIEKIVFENFDFFEIESVEIKNENLSDFLNTDFTLISFNDCINGDVNNDDDVILFVNTKKMSDILKFKYDILTK